MDRVAIKENAKNMLKGNLAVVLKPTLIVFFISFMFNLVLEVTHGNNHILLTDEISITYMLGSLAISIFLTPLTIGQNYYMLKFVRNEDPQINDLWKPFSKFVPIIITIFLMALLISIGYIFFIIPGIILIFGFSMTTYILADNELRPVETLKESWNLMKGYKLDYFIFNVSFIGWMVLSFFSFGILAIWVIPYIMTANTLYYENLLKLKKQQ